MAGSSVTRAVAVAAVAGALALAGCGKGDKQAAGDNATAQAGAGPATPVPAPAGRDWSQVISTTPDGGYRMGNPAAKVKLVEFASLTCPHCAAFSQEGVPQLIQRYVKPGLVSYELRNYLRDPFDATAVLLARCAGPDAFFQLSDQIWADQPNWEGKLQKMSPADQARLQGLPADQLRPAIAQMLGLDQLVEQRGIPASKLPACLNDPAAISSLEKVHQQADAMQIPGTPAFVINGNMIGSATWDGLEPQIKAAVGS